MDMRAGPGRRLRWMGFYAAAYLLGMTALCLAMARCGKTLIWDPDGISQTYTVVGYVGRLVRGLFRGEGVPMMRFSLGQGMDVLTTCAYYGYADPLLLLGALFQGNGIETGYALISLLRAFLAGACLGLYLKKLGVRGDWALACGALIYAMSGYAVHMVGYHVYFLNGMLYLPLLLLGVERILAGEGWLLYVLVAALTLMVNFYFAFMNTVTAIVYILVRLVARLRSRGIGGTARDGFALLGGYLLGAALSAVVFLPVARLYLGNSRLGVTAGRDGSLLRYDGRYYLELMLCAFTPWRSPGYATYLNLSPLALLGLAAALIRRRRGTGQLFAGLALCALGLCVPMAGKLMNGGGYVANRWVYICTLFAAAGAALGLDGLFDGRFRGRRTVAVLALIASALLGAWFLRARQKWPLMAPCLLGALAVLLLAYDGGRLPALSARRTKAGMALLLAAGCAAYAVVGYLPEGYNFAAEEVSRGAYAAVADAAVATRIDDAGVYRVNQARHDDAQSLLLDYMGTSFYWSLVDAGVSDYYRALYLPTQTAADHIYGLCGSAAMNAVAAVKYAVMPQAEPWVVPYGFEAAGEGPGGGAAVYENTLALPLGYAYDRAMSTADYAALPVEGKLQALTACAICDADAVPLADFVSAARTLDYTVASLDGVELREGWIGAEDGGIMTLAFDAPEGCETYLILEGITVDTDTIADDARGGITVETAYGKGECNVTNRRNNFYFDKLGCAFCLGSGALDGCTLTFRFALNYRLDSIRLVSIPLAGYVDSVTARRAESLTDVALGRDSLSGRITVFGERVLQIAVPYSEGWRAWVDGEERPVFRCGGMYMGVALSEGLHRIEMRYVTPGLKAGAAVSLAALALTAALAAMSARRRRRG